VIIFAPSDFSFTTCRGLVWTKGYQPGISGLSYIHL